jgi:small-conductance mechanosensitive channel
LVQPHVFSLVNFINPSELALVMLFKFTYTSVLKAAHSIQTLVYKTLYSTVPLEYDKSILGFVHERSTILVQLMTFNYFAKLAYALLRTLGLDVPPQFSSLVSRVSYVLFMAQAVDLFISRFLRVFFPKIGESKRQSYIVNKTASVLVWTVGALVASEMLSSYLKIPLTSTLAFGGVGGLTIGLSLRDLAANFMGGLMLLFNEPFTPGDTIIFKNEKLEVDSLAVCAAQYVFYRT